VSLSARVDPILIRGIAAPRARVKPAPKQATEAGPSKTQAAPKVGGRQLAEVSSVSFQESSGQQASTEDPLVRAQRAHLEFERAQIVEKERLLALQRGLIDAELAGLNARLGATDAPMDAEEAAEETRPAGRGKKGKGKAKE
jgi:hypothetical protein